MSKQPNRKGTTMAEKQEMAVREKKELTAKEEKTVPGRYFIPYADIYETDDALAVVLEMPGVEKKDLDVALENDVLRVDGRIDFSKYKDLEPVYAEYNVGHYARSFTLGDGGPAAAALPSGGRPSSIGSSWCSCCRWRRRWGR